MPVKVPINVDIDDMVDDMVDYIYPSRIWGSKSASSTSTCVRLLWRDAVQLYASQYSNKVEDITPMNSRQQVYIFVVLFYRIIDICET
jgi:hypothetical protein